MTLGARLGALAIALYAPHAAWHIAHGAAWDLLWACDVAMPLLALACFARQPRLCACAFLFLLYGTPMWLLDLATGGSMVPTSPLIHVGGLVLAGYATAKLGWPRGSWLYAAAGSALLLGISRLVTPPPRNVNLVFRVQSGWERTFPDHGVNLALMWLGATAVFFVAERLARKRYAEPS